MKTGCKWVAQIKTVVFFSAMLLSGGVLAQLENPPWESTLYSDHVLVGVIWDVKNQTAISPDDLAFEMKSAEYLLLGEKHDNPDHHTLQLSVTQWAINLNKLSAVSLEMMDSSIQSKLDDIANHEFASPEGLKTYLDWDSEGWEWEFYGPLIQAALSADIPLQAGNISPETMREVYRSEQPSTLSAMVSEEVMSQLEKDIDVSHCGLLPESQFPAMVRVQQSRDAAMAASLVSPATAGLSLLIAGNYHVRQDLGVPNYLLSADSSLKRDAIISLSFMEVRQELLVASDYVESTDGVDAYDYIWFTPAISDEDYCASMR